MKNLFLLPTDKPSRLIIYSTLLNEFRLLDKPIEDWKHKKNIYITNDEEIKEGDYGILGKTILSYHQMHKKWGMPQGKKIILTTDKDLIADGVQSIPDEFLEWFVKNPSCESVEVKCYSKFNDGDFTDYKIIIPKEEPKQECNCDNTCDKCEEQESIQILKKAKENALKQETLENIKCTCLRPQVNCFSGMCSYCNRQIVKQLTTEDLKPKQGSMAEAIKQVVSNELKQETLEEVAENYFNNFTKRKEEFAFIDGAKWQQEQIYNKIKELYDNENITGFSKRAYAQCLDIVEEFKNK
jgi:hypothetical protein